MKPKPFARILNSALLLLALLAIAPRAHAGTEVIGMELHGVLTTQVSNAPGAKFKTTPISNASIINALITSGAAVGIPKKNLALIHFEGIANTLAVINTGSNNAIIATIKPPTFFDTLIDTVPKPGAAETLRSTNSDYEFTIPGVANTQTTMATERFVVVSGTHIKSIYISYFGGQGTGNPGSTKFVGTAHSTGKYFAH
jgi:hypothetical protein